MRISYGHNSRSMFASSGDPSAHGEIIWMLLFFAGLPWLQKLSCWNLVGSLISHSASCDSIQRTWRLAWRRRRHLDMCLRYPMSQEESCRFCEEKNGGSKRPCVFFPVEGQGVLLLPPWAPSKMPNQNQSCVVVKSNQRKKTVVRKPVSTLNSTCIRCCVA